MDYLSDSDAEINLSREKTQESESDQDKSDTVVNNEGNKQQADSATLVPPNVDELSHSVSK